MSVGVGCVLEIDADAGPDAAARRQGTRPLPVLSPASLSDGMTAFGDEVIAGVVHKTTSSTGAAGKGTPFQLRVSVPSYCRRIKYVKGIVTRLVPAGRKTVEWDSPAKQAGETRSVAGHEFTLKGLRQKGAKVFADVLCSLPEPRTGEPALWRQQMLLGRIHFDDGTSKETGGIHRSFSGKSQRMYFVWPGERRTPIALSMSVATGLAREPLTFRLENVAVPGPALREKGKGPDAARQVNGPAGVSEGFSFIVRRVEVSRTLSAGEVKGQMRIDLDVEFPADRTVVGIGSYALEVEATDDRDTTLPGETRYHMRPARRRDEKHDATTTVLLAPPDDKADKLVALSGKCRFHLAGSTATARFSLPKAGATIEKPVKEGPVTLVSCRTSDGSTWVSVEIGTDTFPSADSSWLRQSRLVLVDGTGRKYERKSGTGIHFAGKRRTSPARFELGEGVPATLVVSYPAECVVKSIPFRFEDVLLPARPARPASREEVF